MLVQEKVLRGITTLLILRNLEKSPSHGYVLQKEISTELKQDLPSGAIYILLKNLERKQLIRRESKVEVNGRMITQYRITAEGKRFLKRHVAPLETVEGVLGDLIRDIRDMD
ncbi:MAG: PadR family transcriptional regulator [Thermoplasmatales archaeon]|jgi:DNA-binding PadR family transcriptional regulator|nr:PadR family transcriptional regulator [Candidatus Thermoplasmatota archaeon]MCL6002038.1 PadR family transcriptional regulator [Candidatus Thermoplasmatota archaeon]MDA8054610.1 PadR family transcriptional regulator [Thermoplasmatales archaeon]